MQRIGVITGLAREVDCLAPRGGDGPPRVRCAGADGGRAGDGAEALVSEGCVGLVSFGLAAGLSARARPGTLVLATAVVTAAGERFETERTWRARLRGALPSGAEVVEGVVLGCERALLSARAKDVAAERSGAVAADMESHGVGRVAVANGVPFLVVRAVADPRDRTVPPWVTASIDVDGSIRFGVVAAALLTRPWDVARLLRLGVDGRAGLATLRRVAAAAGASFRLVG